MEMKKFSFYLLLMTLVLSCGKDGSSDTATISGSNETPGNSGGGGSTARFAISGNTLYTVNTRSLKTFDISTPGKPVAQSITAIGNDIETIFPKDDYLFIGSQSGMFIYDISNPSAPMRVGHYEHVVSCDPVVANDDYAYVTLRSAMNGQCRRGINQLEILDISNPAFPQIISQKPMKSPRGLGIDANLNLYVCDEGLVHFDVTQPNFIKQLGVYPMDGALDVIPVGNRLFVIAQDGFYQYELVNGALSLLSKIPVG